MKFNRFKKFCGRFLAVALCLTLLTGILNPFIIAEEPAPIETNQAEQEKSELLETEKNAETDPLLGIIIKEDMSRRGEYEKHFLCDNGNYIAVSYPEPVHMLRDGVWVDIEYALETDSNNRISPADKETNVSLPATADAKEPSLVRLCAGEYEISWTVEANNRASELPRQLNPSAARIKTTSEILAQNKDAAYSSDLPAMLKVKQAALENIERVDVAERAPEKMPLIEDTNASINAFNRRMIQGVTFGQALVEYPGALGDGTTLRYTLSEGCIKEEIVLDAPSGFESYSMRVNTDGLKAVLGENNSVNFVDGSGETIITIEPPCMYDAGGDISSALTVAAEQNADECVITYIPDKEWMDDEARVWPIVIDPSVTTKGVSQINQIDTYVSSGTNGVSVENGNLLYMGWVPTEHQAFWRIDQSNMPTIPYGERITYSSFNARLTDGTTTMGSIGLYTANNYWNSNSVTWSNKPNIDGDWGSISTIPFDNWLAYWVTPAVQGWYAGSANYGFILKYSSYANDYNCVYSSDHRPGGSTAYIPYLYIEYT